MNHLRALAATVGVSYVASSAFAEGTTTRIALSKYQKAKCKTGTAWAINLESSEKFAAIGSGASELPEQNSVTLLLSSAEALSVTPSSRSCMLLDPAW